MQEHVRHKTPHLTPASPPRARPTAPVALPLLLPPVLLLLGAACGSPCVTEAPLDYTRAEHWLCAPGQGECARSSVVHDVDPDGQPFGTHLVRPAPDPQLACFVVYPTLDLRLGVGLHHQTRQVDGPERWLLAAPRLLNTACEIHAPVYRQVTIGTYLGDDRPRKSRCFDAAYDDVDAAFDTFLDRIGDRPFALFGHSQGGQHLSRLLRERVDTDPDLRDRLVVAWPLGWALGTAVDTPTGGSFTDVPVCEGPDQTGCALGFRSFLDDQELPSTGRFAEGDRQVCAHPDATAPADDWAPMSAFVTRHDDPDLRRRPSLHRPGPHDLVSWATPAEARCRGSQSERALAVRWSTGEPPFRVPALPFLSQNGTHIHDVGLGIVDIAQDLQRRLDAWSTSR